MRYQIQITKFIDLVNLYNEDNLNLNPPYQRNSIWTIANQRLLIDTIKSGLPLPTFFIQPKNGKFEMVDGQQRTRALLSYMSEDGFIDANGVRYNKGEFDDYLIGVVSLNEDFTEEEVREFYVRVNRAGARLERPELNKAAYFKTRFLAVTTEISEMVEFRELKVVKSAQVRRMFDRDFIEEISALILYGPQDKKTTVDQMYKEDISEEKAGIIKNTFKDILEKMAIFNAEIPLSDTRFVQKNDFYTFFNLMMKIDNLTDPELVEMYKVLVLISKGISPSNKTCEPLKEYAENCVTQSNSKKARNRRVEILIDILLNETPEINQTQKDLVNFYGLPNELVKIGKYYTLNIN